VDKGNFNKIILLTLKKAILKNHMLKNCKIKLDKKLPIKKKRMKETDKLNNK
jgi:hypothetical protein